jgi:sugar diacid utilization regulator
VAIVVPRLGAAVASPGAAADLGLLRRYVGDRSKDRPAQVPPGILAEVPITSGDEVLGGVLLLDTGTGGAGPVSDEALEFLHLAAVASLTEIAVEEAKEEVEQNLRGSFLEELRSRPEELDTHEVVRRAGRLGCDLSRGAVVLCAELTTDRPRHVVATIAGEHPGALAQHMDVPGDAARVYALLPATGGDEAPEGTLAAARRLAGRLQRHGTVGLSSFYADPAELGRAMQEAELVLDVLRRSDGMGGAMMEDIGTGTYRLLFRVLASHPEEVRSFYEDTVAPIVKYDDQYATDLVGTLEAYLEQNCNMNATAAAIYAHRHTVAYRLERVKELTGLDPMQSEDRERLGLGLKAYRIIAPRLPR